jgi:DNA invertase Pin-like site-specific DNA recombinase
MSTENAKGYKIESCRVSTHEQNEDLQRDALTAAGCDRIFFDTASGKLESRPALDAMLEQLRPGDLVLVWRLDRLGRPLRHLIDLARDLENEVWGLAA